MKKHVWKSDWFAGLIIPLVFLFTIISAFSETLENKIQGFSLQKTKCAKFEINSTSSLQSQSLNIPAHFYLTQTLPITTQYFDLTPKYINNGHLCERVISIELTRSVSKLICT